LVRFGIYLPQTDVDYEDVREVALESERLGFDSVWLSDHLQPPGGDPRGELLECWTTLSALAEATKKIRLGTLVLCNLFRNPSLLAKMAATLDQISGGRLEFGIGSGWHRAESIAYGIPFPSATERIQQLQEALEVIVRIWVEERPSFRGRYYSISEAYCNPRPVQKPHPPIWIGTMVGKKRMLKTVAKYADGWTISSVFLPTAEEYSSMYRDLARYCSKASRRIRYYALGVGCIIAEDESRVKEKALQFQPARLYLEDREYIQPRIEGTPEQCIQKLGAYTKLGVTHLLLNFPDIRTLEPLQLFAKTVMPALT